jgi:hypothetical protein
MTQRTDSHWEKARRILDAHHRKTLARIAKEIVRDEPSTGTSRSTTSPRPSSTIGARVFAIEKVSSEMGRMAAWARDAAPAPKQRYRLTVITGCAGSVEADVNAWLEAQPRSVPYAIDAVPDASGRMLRSASSTSRSSRTDIRRRAASRSPGRRRGRR